MKNQSGIYEILNTVNGKRYIGSSVSFKPRWKSHRVQLRGNRHHNQYLQRAWNKYGEAAFKFLPILTCAKSMLLFYEQQLLDKVKPEYNFALNATAPMLGIKFSESHKAKIAKANKGKPRTPAQLASSSEPKSPEHRAKISATLTGRRLPAEQCQKKSMSMMGNKFGLGVKRSPEAIEKTISALRGKQQSPETIAKRVLATTGKRRTAEQRLRMSIAARLRVRRQKNGAYDLV